MFPGLNYTLENSNNNIKRWQQLADEKRLRGWTPKKLNKNDEKNSEKNNNINNNKGYKLGGGFGNIKSNENN